MLHQRFRGPPCGPGTTGSQRGEELHMGAKDAADAAELKKRAERLRECAREARTLARSLGPYLDGAVKKAAPRAGDFRAGNDANAIWQGPFADECTAKLQQRQHTLNGMGGALLADATRWENQADELERQAKEKDKAKAGTGGN
jgi:hypothetical protein